MGREHTTEEILACAIDWIYEHIPRNYVEMSTREDLFLTEFVRALKGIGMSYGQTKKVLVEDYCYRKKDIAPVLNNISPVEEES